eukprot:TRINITY_DN6106_c0_g3_i3.p1 TRINITY_DN6106_c0_g3~~TRINITY_DN6106_c0_g3_i3.p1  ORF type:complete len:318 (+),score=83.83 TRINITY_DN6106_c0_g3_i3:73-1026(+)
MCIRDRYKRMAEELGVEANCVSGWAKGARYDPEAPLGPANHDWNAVKVGGKWYLVDAAWGAGNEIRGKYVREYSSYYFGPNPGRLIRSHWPADEKWQLLTANVSKENFEALLKYNGDFYDCGLLSTNPDTAIIQQREIVNIVINYDPAINMQVKAKLEYYNGHTYTEASNGWFVQKLSTYFHCTLALSKRGKYRATFYVKLATQENYYSAFAYIIHCDQDAKRHKELPSVYKDFSATKAVLHAPLTGPLKWGSVVEFKVQICGVKEVVVQTNSLVPLNKDDDIFAGKVEIDSEEVAVYYMYPGMTSYSGLLQYSVIK